MAKRIRNIYCVLQIEEKNIKLHKTLHGGKYKVYIISHMF